MKMNMTVGKKLIRTAAAVLIGGSTVLLLLWLAALGVEAEKLPDEYLTSYAMAGLFLGACTGGACTPAGKGRRLQSGLVTGAALAGILLLSKAIAGTSQILGMKTGISVLLCLGGGSLGSCIFHKNAQKRRAPKKRKAPRR